MSGQVKLTLRPPPNVDFVHGYPGIPPGAADRPQATVKGAIEVRTGPQGVKAKWVRVELRKVETLPGGGLQNTFYDFVGPSPVTLWTAGDEYGELRSQDFPFQIRVPESVPPSIALEGRAGIKYELLASVCTKGKKGFLRRRKSNVVSTQAAIIIDKHELHSTWPVYCQPETRQISHEGVTLTVERNHTCYGPGDRISVMATLKSDSLQVILLRGFELTLKESSVFRSNPYVSGKKTVPQVRVAVVTETRLPVNFSLYGGMVQKAELTCAVSPNHTTTTLNTARHIDITYLLCVKALLGTGQPLVMELPVILSNWQRNVSHEAIRRIGPAPGLSLLPATATGGVNNTNTLASQTNISTRPPMTVERATSSGQSTTTNNTLQGNTNTLQGNTNTLQGNTDALQGNMDISSKPDELGYVGYSSKPGTANGPKSTLTSKSSTDEFNKVVRPGSAAGTSAANGNRLAGATPPQQPWKLSTTTTTAAQNKWPSAEDEKRGLYERAKERAEATQAGAMAQSNMAPATTTPTTQVRNAEWLSAEEEKTRLFNKAQEAARIAQGLETYVSPSPSPPQINRPTAASYASSMPQYPTAEEEKAAQRRYEEAKQAVQRTHLGGTDDVGSSSSSYIPRLLQDSRPAMTSPSASIPQYPTAEEEKAAQRRYEEAKRAVQQTQLGETDDIGSSSSSYIPPAAIDLPPSFEASVPVVDARTQLAEKERLRREYEVQDAAAAAAAQPLLEENAPAYSHDPQPQPLTGTIIQSAIAEKEMLRRKFEMQDAQARAASSSPSQYSRPASPKTRPTPAPPSSPGRILTAAEEKALLRARFEAEDSAYSQAPASTAPPPQINGYSHINGYTNGTHAGPSTPSPTLVPPLAPPPLAPKPPAAYIQETQEEDARVSRYVNSGAPLPDLDYNLVRGSSLSRDPSASIAGLDIRPFTPFSTGFDGKTAGLPPPLPNSSKRD